MYDCAERPPALGRTPGRAPATGTMYIYKVQQIIYIYIYICVCIYIYIHTYIHIPIVGHEQPRLLLQASNLRDFKDTVFAFLLYGIVVLGCLFIF